RLVGPLAVWCTVLWCRSRLRTCLLWRRCLLRSVVSTQSTRSSPSGGLLGWGCVSILVFYRLIRWLGRSGIVVVPSAPWLLICIARLPRGSLGCLRSPRIPGLRFLFLSTKSGSFRLRTHDAVDRQLLPGFFGDHRDNIFVICWRIQPLCQSTRGVTKHYGVIAQSQNARFGEHNAGNLIAFGHASAQLLPII